MALRTKNQQIRKIYREEPSLAAAVSNVDVLYETPIAPVQPIVSSLAVSAFFIIQFVRRIWCPKVPQYAMYSLLMFLFFFFVSLILKNAGNRIVIPPNRQRIAPANAALVSSAAAAKVRDPRLLRQPGQPAVQPNTVLPAQVVAPLQPNVVVPAPGMHPLFVVVTFRRHCSPMLNRP